MTESLPLSMPRTYNTAFFRISPMQLSSILIADPSPDGSATVIPPAIQRNIASFKAHHPGLPHRLYDRPAIRHFLHEEMGSEVLWAFDQLLPYAYKADLARLCLLYVHGGLYADLSVHFTGAWDVIPGKIGVFRDRAVAAPWIASNTILAAPARFPAVEAAIRMILANCRTRHRGNNPLSPTGPLLLGKALAMHCEPEEIRLGEVSDVSTRDGITSLVFVDTHDGRVIACRAKSKAGLSELGMTHGVNDYNRFYYAGVIFAGDFPVSVPAAVLHARGQARGEVRDDLLVCRTAATTTSTTNTAHLVVHASLMPFGPGTYTVVLDVASVSRGGVLSLIVHGDGGAEVAREVRCFAGMADGDDDGPLRMAVRFTLTATRDDILFAVTMSNAAQTCLRSLSVHCEPPDGEVAVPLP